MRGAQIISLHYNLTNKAKHAFLRERGGVGLPSTEARRMSASIVSRVGILPEVLANLTRPLGDREVRGGLNRASLLSSEATCARFETHERQRKR